MGLGKDPVAGHGAGCAVLGACSSLFGTASGQSRLAMPREKWVSPKTQQPLPSPFLTPGGNELALSGVSLSKPASATRCLSAFSMSSPAYGLSKIPPADFFNSLLYALAGTCWAMEVLTVRPC